MTIDPDARPQSNDQERGKDTQNPKPANHSVSSAENLSTWDKILRFAPYATIVSAIFAALSAGASWRSSSASWASADAARTTLEISQRPEVLAVPNKFIPANQERNLLISISNEGKSTAILTSLKYSMVVLKEGQENLREIKYTNIRALENDDLFEKQREFETATLQVPSFDSTKEYGHLVQVNILVNYQDRSGAKFSKRACLVYVLSQQGLTMDQVCPFYNDTRADTSGHI